MAVNTVCLCTTYSKQPTKNGGSFMGGNLSFKDGQVGFKAWGNSRAFNTLDETLLAGKVVEITAEVNVYQGVKSLVVSAIREVPQSELDSVGLTASDFMYSKYNIEAFYDAYMAFLKKNLSEKAFGVFNTIMADVKERFCMEYAASFYHDSCKGGLLAHSLKVVQMASSIKRYPNILKHVSPDLLYFGSAVHDIGKIREYANGAMSKEGLKLSHNVSGVLMMDKYHDLIVGELGEDFFTGVCSIISGHHGEVGEPPRTVAAYVVHLLDLIESRLAGLDDMLSKSEDGRVVCDGFKLS